MFTHHTTRAGAHLHGTDPGTIVNEQGPILQFSDGIVQLAPVLFAQLSGPKLYLIDATNGREHSEDQALCRHLKAENQHRLVTRQHRMFDEIHGESSFPHGRPTRHDDQIRLLPS